MFFPLFYCEVTRAMQIKIAEMDVAMNTKILVRRDVGLDKYILENAALLNRNRNRLSAQIQPKNIPFGVRGRRRIRVRRHTIMFIGVQPNVDNNAAQNQQSPMPSSWVPARAATPAATPARRVYRRLTFTPSPDQHLMNQPAEPAEDSTVDVHFDELFGRLSLFD